MLGLGMWRQSFILSFCIFFAVIFFSFYADAKCGDREKQSHVYQAFDSCREALLAQTTESANQSLEKLRKNGFCSALSDSLSKDKAAICSDPSGFVCEHAKGLFFNNKCELWIVDTRDAANVPAYVDNRCAYTKQVENFLQLHAKECSQQESSEDCKAAMILKHGDELLKMQSEILYNPEKVKKAQAIFKRVVDAYIKMLESSRQLTSQQKETLILQIKRTELSIPPPKVDPPSCTYDVTTGPDTGIYHNNLGKIIFCAGAVALLDSVNEYDLIWTIAHELTHSVDPCSLEKYGVERTKVYDVYGPLMKCLRGGTGPDGCVGASLHCNSHAQLTGENSKTADCPHGPKDPGYDGHNLADYYKGPVPTDQVQESVADYMGAEITGMLMKEDKLKGKLSEAGKFNAMVAIASDISRLHGNCVSENTHDPHPPGFLRTNRVVMGSEIFRESIGCKTPPTTQSGGGITCQGF